MRMITTALTVSLLAVGMQVATGTVTGAGLSAQDDHVATDPVRGDGRGDRVTGADWATRSVVFGQNGMAATSHPLASQIAIDILKAGGSAADAAIAANAALGLMEPTGCGIGGDLFAIVWDPETKTLHGLNASGRAPMGQSLDDLRAKLDNPDDIPEFGSLSVTIPGAVDGWFSLHDRFGKLAMGDNLAPAIVYAENGFPVTQVIALYMGAYKDRYPALVDAGVIEEIDNWQATFMPSGDTPKEGEIFRNPDLGRTYRAIVKGGRDAFYKGKLADVMDAYFQRIGAPHRKADFEAHSSTWIDPVSVNYRGYDVWELPPNGQGIAALQMLNILEGYDLAAMGHNSADYLHVMVEAKKQAFEDRARFYADPDFYPVSLDVLLSKEYAATQRADIDMTKAATQVDHGDPQLIKGDTIYLTVADKDGMMVSLIQSNYRGMGSGLVPDGLGFAFQDRGAQFSTIEGHPNAYAPGKRPFHTIIPAFITKDNKPLLSFGLMGGAMQPQGHVQIVSRIVDFGMNIQEAGDAARYHHQGSTSPTWQGRMDDGGVLELESGVTADVIAELRARGHSVRLVRGPFGGYQAIWRDPVTGVYGGASEMRKDGMAIGY